ncbi:hypothetical protein UFOVP1475_13 [uncultured Caudovirales phage]|jgi:hypothetical protein|uniref:Uncharacterized protein n=1 Tax=uncultured Caudovirales phage TaxID=2100421 RepID=A0A6J5SMR0_9CAUD|nr:hypothetical protein UFOVP1475_13 [uncultured Caudovirales phage]
MNKFHPLTAEEFDELDKTISQIGAYLPENKANYIWNNFNKLRDAVEPQPCTCASSGNHWKRAMDYLWNWVKDRK